MHHHIFSDQQESYNIALLFKPNAFNKDALVEHYVNPLERQGIDRKDIVACTLEYNQVGKAPVKFIKEYLDTLLPALADINVKVLYVADSAYFKVLTGQVKAEPHYGYKLACKIPNYEYITVILGINYQALFYDPGLQDRLDLSINTLGSIVTGIYTAPGTGIIHSAYYPDTLAEIASALDSLHQYPELTADIEGFSLRFNEAGIGTIAFAWDEHNGIAFPVDFCEYEGYTGSKNIPNEQVRIMLKRFFEEYKGNITWHSANYDVKVLIYVLWMKNLLDTEGLLYGLHLMCKNINDTKIITYLATNSCAGNTLGLKHLAQEFAGNWAVEEIKDIKLIPKKKLLQYNLVDALSTFYVKKKYYPIMVADQQLDVYKNLFLPIQKMLIQTELIGMPLDAEKVKNVKAKLETIQQQQEKTLFSNPLITTLNMLVQQDAMETANAKLKIKQHPLSAFSHIQFNPNSGPQLQYLLYELLGLPVIDRTDTKQPATGGKTLKKLLNLTTDPAKLEILNALIEYSSVSKILNTFIPAFEAALDKGDGIVWLHGNFNPVGTVSGRLSSNEPNLQNLPANSTWGKLIKECFRAPEGWLFGGADFNSLEDYISALTTKDPNKLKVYIDGFDGHCLRAASYYADTLTDIDIDNVDSVNSIAVKYPKLRQESKTPTFALTYQGTWITLVKNLGLTPEKAMQIEERFKTLYRVSIEYINERLKQAAKDGYVTVAFGLRVRTPVLEQVIFGDKRMFEAMAEGRTAGNAMGQSYCMLNNRAAVAFMKEVWASEHRLNIKPVALIHDAIYLVWKDDVEITKWVNDHLIKAMQWQELPEIAHDVVKIGAALDIFWPNWSNGITLPNNASEQQIVDCCRIGADKYRNPTKKPS